MSKIHPEQITRRALSRRQVLKQVALGSAGLVLGACGESAYVAPPEATGASASGAGAQATAVATAPAATGNRTIVRFHHRTEYGDYHKQQAEAFNKSQDRIEVRLELTPFSEYEQTLTTLVAGDQLGDAYAAAPFHNFYPFAARGIAADIRSLADSQGFDLDIFFPAVIEQLTWEGKLAGLPQGTHAGWTSMYTNLDLWSKAGVETPKWEWTYQEEWLSALQSVQKSLDGEGGKQFAFQLDYVPQGVYTFLRSWGGDWIDPNDRTKSMINSDASVAALRFVHSLIHEHKVTPPAKEVVENMWGNGLSASWATGLWYVGTANATIKDKFKWQVFPMPAGPAGRSTFLGADSICINSGSKNPEATFEWCKWLVSKEAGIAAMQSGMPVPARRDVWEDPIIANDVNYEPSVRWMEVSKPVTIPANARIAELRTAMQQGLEAFFLESTPSDAAIQQLHAAVQGVLDKS